MSSAHFSWRRLALLATTALCGTVASAAFELAALGQTFVHLFIRRDCDRSEDVTGRGGAGRGGVLTVQAARSATQSLNGQQYGNIDHLHMLYTAYRTNNGIAVCFETSQEQR